MKVSMKATIPIIIVTSLCIPMESRAYLGGFEPNDGYQSFVNWVNGYNAGQYGSANGGPVGSLLAGPNPPAVDFVGGLWNDKNDAFGTYNVNPNVFSGGYYVTGHNTVAGLGMFPHNGNQMLALRNTSYANIAPTNPAVPLDYRYALDTRDFYNGGTPINPADTGNKIVEWSVWAGPGPVTAPSTDGIWLSFQDNMHNIGFQFGWDETYKLRYRANVNDPWTNTQYVFGRPWVNLQAPVVYDRFDFSIDLLNDKWSLNVFSTLGNTNMLFVTDLAFGTPLANFTEIDWHVGYGNEKGFFDDSAFVVRTAQVPEPGTFALVALGGLLCWRARVAR